MNKKFKNLILVCITAFLIVIVCIIGFLFNRRDNEMFDRINEIDAKVENLGSADVISEGLLQDISILSFEISEMKEYNEKNDKDQIILNYQDAQEKFERRINTFLILLGILYPIIVGSGIVIPLLNLKKIENQIKVVNDEKEEIQKQLAAANQILKKNNLMQEIETIFNIYNNDKTNMATLEILVEKIDELLSDYQLDDFQRCTYLLYKAHDLVRLNKNSEAEKVYNKACFFAKKTKSKHVVADACYKRALFYRQAKKAQNAITSINVSIEQLPGNIIYLKFRRDMFRNLLSTATSFEDKSMYKERISRDTKELWEIDINGRGVGYSELFHMYHPFNDFFEQTDKDDMDWLCNELDKIMLGENDIRFFKKLNIEYVKTLKPKKQKEYIEKGYADSISSHK